MARPWAPAAALVFNAFVWGLSWWPFRALHDAGLHPLWATALIYGLSLSVLLAWAPGAARAFFTTPALWPLFAAAGFTNLGFNWAVTVGDVVRVVLLFYLMPAWSVLLAWVLLGERPTPAALLRLVLALAGVAVVLGQGAGWPVPRGLADWLSLAGGFSFALTNVLLRRLAAVPAPGRVFAMFGGGMTTAGCAALLGLAQGWVPAPPAPALAWGAVAVGLAFAFLLGNLALQFGASRLPARTTTLVLLSEVAFASFSSVALGAGQMTPSTWLGGAMILAAAGWAAWPDARPRSTIAA